MPRWYYKPAIIGFELQERGSTCEAKVFIEENLPKSKHHVTIRRQGDKPLDRPDVAEFANPILSSPHALIEFTRDGRLNVIDKTSERGTFRVREGRNKFQPDVAPAAIPLSLEEGDVIQLGSFLPDDPATPIWLEIKPIYDRTPLAEVKNGQTSESRKARTSSKVRANESRASTSKLSPPVSTSSSDDMKTLSTAKPKLLRGCKRKRVLSESPPASPAEGTPREMLPAKSSDLVKSPPGTTIIVDTTTPSADKVEIHQVKRTRTFSDIIDLTAADDYATDMDISSSRDDTPVSCKGLGVAEPDNVRARLRNTNQSSPGVGTWESERERDRTIEVGKKLEVEPEISKIPAESTLDETGGWSLFTEGTFYKRQAEDLGDYELWLPPDSDNNATDEIPGFSIENEAPASHDKPIKMESTEFGINGKISQLQRDGTATDQKPGVSLPLPTTSLEEGSPCDMIMSTPEISDEFDSIPGLSPSASASASAQGDLNQRRFKSQPKFSTEPPTPSMVISALEPPISPSKPIHVLSSDPHDLRIVKTEADLTPSLDTTASRGAIGHEGSSSTYPVQLSRDEQSASSVDYKSHLPLIKREVYEPTRIPPPRAGSISQDMSDLRIRTTNDDIQKSRQGLSESSPEGSPGASQLSPYLGHGNKHPRLRKFYQQR